MPTGQADDTFERLYLAVQAALRAGVSTADAATMNGISARTIERWLERGRKTPQSRYGPFARSVDGLRAEREKALASVERTGDLYEVFQLVGTAARLGSVSAMRLYWKMLKAQPDRQPPKRSMSA